MRDFKLKNQFILATYIIILSFLLLNIKTVGNVLNTTLSILKPFIIGLAIAFLLNVPMKSFENRLIGKIVKKYNIKNSKIIIRIISLILTLITIGLLLSAFINLVIPQLVKSTSSLISSIPQDIDSLQSYITTYMSHINISDNLHHSLLSGVDKMSDFMIKTLNYFISNIVGITFSITSIITNLLLGFVIAIYMLLSKDKLIIQFKKVLYGLLSENMADKIMSIIKLGDVKFSKFIVGQCTDGIVMGSLCFIGMTIFDMPYAILISTLIGITDLIPIFGTFLGAALSALILFMIKPVTALYFIIMIVIIQQVEGNFIYPFIVGNSIGLSSFWILVPIIIGSSMFGVLGILIGVPLFSMIYTLCGGYINNRIKSKNINIQK